MVALVEAIYNLYEGQIVKKCIENNETKFDIPVPEAILADPLFKPWTEIRVRFNVDHHLGSCDNKCHGSQLVTSKESFYLPVFAGH